MLEKQFHAEPRRREEYAKRKLKKRFACPSRLCAFACAIKLELSQGLFHAKTQCSGKKYTFSSSAHGQTASFSSFVLHVLFRIFLLQTADAASFVRLFCHSVYELLEANMSQSVTALPVSVEQLAIAIRQLRGDTTLSADEPFLGQLTLGEYLDLPDDKRAALWEAWAGTDLMELEEQEV